MGDAGRRRGAARDRSRPRVRHRRARHDAPLYRAAVGAGARDLLDVGSGSGIVAIAAAKLGFSPVLGVDVDIAAVEAARRNAAANAVAIDVRAADATTEPLAPADVAVANISLPLVQSLLPRIEARVVVASGYLERDDPRLGPYVRRVRRVRDGWAADLLERAE